MRMHQVDVSFQFWLPEDRLLQLWSDYKFTYLSSFRKAAQSSLRDVAAGESGGRRGQASLPVCGALTTHGTHAQPTMRKSSSTIVP